MTIKITHQSELVTEFEVHKFSAFASDLGLRAYEFPERIETDLGNGMPFVFAHSVKRDGDLEAVVYRQGNGCIFLHVLND